MRHYQVFLPPPCLTPLSHYNGETKAEHVAPAALGLKFVDLPDPVDGVGSLKSPIAITSTTSVGHTTNNQTTGGSAEKSYERSTVLVKRSLFERGAIDDGPKENDTFTMTAAALGAAVRGADIPEDTTTFSWPPTIPPPPSAVSERPLISTHPRTSEVDMSRRRSRRIARSTGSLLGTLLQLDPSPFPASGSTSAEVGGTYDSLDSTTSSFPSQSFVHHREGAGGDGDRSVYNLPTWSVPLNRLRTLQSILSREGGREGHRLTTVMLCVLSVDQPVVRRRKEEKARGQDGSLWIGKWVVTAPPVTTGGGGQGGEVSCTVRLWDECAEKWGDEKVRRGDVVLLENVEMKSANNKDPAHLALTPHTTPKLTILYRTIPRYTTVSSKADYIYRPQNHNQNYSSQERAQEGRRLIPEDRALRPDLRVGRSDAGVRKVAEAVRWFAEWVGGEAPA